jgi:hypothetical protein
MTIQSILEKVIVAVLSAALLAGGGWFAARFFADSPQIVTAEVNMVKSPNPLALISAQQLKQVDAMAAAGGFGALSRNIEVLRYSGSVGVGYIELRNNSRARSKEVEVSVKQGFGWSASMDGDAQSVRPDFKIKPIEPGGKSELYFVSQTIFSQGEVPVSVIHDNLRVDLQIERISTAFPGYKYLVLNFPYLVFMCIVGAVLTLGIIAIALIQQFFARAASPPSQVT